MPFYMDGRWVLGTANLAVPWSSGAVTEVGIRTEGPNRERWFVFIGAAQLEVPGPDMAFAIAAGWMTGEIRLVRPFEADRIGPVAVSPS